MLWFPFPIPYQAGGDKGNAPSIAVQRVVCVGLFVMTLGFCVAAIALRDDPAGGEPFDLLDPVIYVLGPVAAVLAVAQRLVLSKKAAGKSGAAQAATRFMARLMPLATLEGATLLPCVAYYLGAPDAPALVTMIALPVLMLALLVFGVSDGDADGQLGQG